MNNQIIGIYTMEKPTPKPSTLTELVTAFYQGVGMGAMLMGGLMILAGVA